MSKEYTRRSLRALQAYVPGEQPSADEYIKLNTNENPYPASPKVGRALAEVSVDQLRLYPDPVCDALRRQLAAYHQCEPENIIVGNGSDEVLALSIRAFVERDEAIGFLDPSYSLYPVLAAIEGIGTTRYPLESDFSWRPPDVADGPLFLLANPNAPTGRLLPRDAAEAFCAAFTGVVVVDEAYVDFAASSMVDTAWQSENVLVSRSLSKSFSLAGLRLGYAVGPPPLIAALMKIKDSYNVSLLAQVAAAAALEDIPHMRANADKICATRDMTAQALAARSFMVTPSDTNFLWVSPPDGNAAALFDALKAKKILVRHFPGERTGAFLRITVGTADEMQALLGAVDEILAAG